MQKPGTHVRWMTVAVAALAAGCGGAEDRASQGAAGAPERISLSGCVALSRGGGQGMALENVLLAEPGEQPSGARTQTSSNAIEDGTWVRVAMAGGDDSGDRLRQLIGRRVTVRGTIEDDGRDRVGTSGPQPGPQQPESRPPDSQAGATGHYSEKVAKEVGPIGQQSMATGLAPLILVQELEDEGACHSVPQDRR